MDSGFKKLFLRRRSKSKPLLISEPLQDTFRQTGGYDEFAAGSTPTIGTRPIKPSEQTGARKSFSHTRTKSAGLQDFRQLVHTNTDSRPRTASGIETSLEKLSIPSGRGHHYRASQDGTNLRSDDMQGLPKVSELPKGLAESGGPKYFDLFEAAVSASKVKAPAESTRTYFDFYNESVANRNSIYGKSLISPRNKDVFRVSPTQEDKHAAVTHPMDTQRASFNAMRTSRYSKVSSSHCDGERIGADVPATSLSRVNDAVPGSLCKMVSSQKRSDPDRISAPDVLPPKLSSEGHRMKSNSGRYAGLPPQQSSISREGLTPAIPAVNLSSPTYGSKSFTSRQRSKTTSMESTSNHVPEENQMNDPATLVLKPLEDELSPLAAVGTTVISSGSVTIRKTQSISTGRDRKFIGQPRGTASDYVPPRISSDRPTRIREKKNRPSRDCTKTERTLDSQQVRVSASRRRLAASSTVVDLTADDEGKKADYGVGTEEAATHQADPIQILRASVISANGYIYKGGDDVILGTVLQHQNIGPQSISKDVNAPGESKYRKVTATPAKASSLTRARTSGSVLQSPPGKRDREPTRARPAEPPSYAFTTTSTFLNTPPREAPEARTSLPKSKYSGQTQSSEPSVEAAVTQSSLLRPSNITASPRTAGHLTEISAASYRCSDLEPTNSRDVSAPPTPPVLTRDFAHPQIPPHKHPSECVDSFQPKVNRGIITPISMENEKVSLGGYVHIRQEELAYDSSELDRSIATKKEAAAKALLKLQRVMAMPTWEEPADIGQPRASTKGPVHWRGLSIEDGGPIAPSAIFQKVKLPVSQSPVSTHLMSSDQRERDSERSQRKVANGNTGVAGTQAPQRLLDSGALNQVQQETPITAAASIDPRGPPGLERRGESVNDVSKEKRPRSRIGSTTSVASGTSAYSVPYYMVPARGSSLRDSQSSSGDFFEAPRLPVGDLGWQ